MPQYSYKAITKSGKKEAGVIEAASEEEASTNLHHQGLIVTNLKAAGAGNLSFSFSKKIPFKEKIIFTRQLSIMIKSGLPVVRALEALIEQSENLNLKKITSDVTQEVKGGAPLSKALSKFPDAFSPMFTNVIASGEKSGKLEEVLNNLADQQENDFEIVSKVKSAMVYPIVILCLLVAVILLVILYIIPQLSSVFGEMGGDLPATTKFLMDLSGILRKYYLIVLIIIGAFVFLMKKFVKTKSGEQLLDKIKIKFPVFGLLNKKLYIARFTRTMAMLIGAGLPMLEVIKTSGEVINNSIYAASIKKMSDDVENGTPLSKSMQGDKNFPPMVGHMISIGEQSGKLDYVLDQVAAYYEREVATMTKNLSSLIEPLLMVLMGVGVGFVAISVLGPINSVTNSM